MDATPTAARRVTPPAWLIAAVAVLAIAGAAVVTRQVIGRDDALHRVSYGGLSLTVPTGWLVTDSGSGNMSYPGDALEYGPFIATVPTGPICHPTASGWSCDLSSAITHRPTDGVVGWVKLGRLLPQADLDADPGPSTAEICGTGIDGGHPFHLYKLLPSAADGLRVAFDGCTYGPRAATLAKQVTRVGDSIQLG
jgi:HAMP domain-containing protein